MKTTVTKTIAFALCYTSFCVAVPAAFSQNLEWTRQLGTSGRDISNGVSADSLGNVYISGWTQGSLGGPNAGFDDAFVAKFSDPIPEPSSATLRRPADRNLPEFTLSLECG